MKLKDNLPNHLKDKKDCLLNLKGIPIACIKCRKYGHHATKCEKGEKAKKGKDKREKTKKKQDGEDIKPVTLQDLMTEEKIVKQEIKEGDSTKINKQNIAEIANLKYFPRPLIDYFITGIIMTEPLDPPKDKEVTKINVSNNNKIDSNRQNSLSLIRDTEINLIINKEFSLIEVTLTDSGDDNMNCIQERLKPLKYYERSFERLTQIFNYKLSNVHICNDGICFETVLVKDLSSKVVLRNPFIVLIYPFLGTDEGIKTNVPFNFILPLIPKEIDSLNNVTILKDTNKERIYRTKRSSSFLKTEISLDDQLIDNDIKKFKQDKETKICSYFPIVFFFCKGTDIQSKHLVKKNLVEKT